MSCTSGSVKSVANRTVAAKEQIDKLQTMIKEQESVSKAAFFATIDEHLADANVTDAKELAYNSAAKTEYTSEFSLDRIAAVVTDALKALEKAVDPSVASPPTSSEAIAAYAEVVNSVAEAAKSSSTASASLSFSMNRLSPGVLAFLYATSTSIKDADTFGTEAVTTTLICYRLMQSIDDVKNEAKFGAAVIDAKNLLNMKRIQAGLTDDLANELISLDEWMKKDEQYSIAIKRIQDRLDAEKFDTAAPFVLARGDGFGVPVRHSFDAGSTLNQEVVRSAIERLSAKGEAYEFVIETSEVRLKAAYY